MPARKDPAAELAENLLRVLEAQRQLGADSYPLALRRLVELTDPAAPADQVAKAVKKKSFKDRAILSHTKNPDAPVALAEDADRLAESPQLLEFALGSACTPESPTHDAARLPMKVPTGLRTSFDAALRRRIQDGTLPPGVAVLTQRTGRGKARTLLHLTRYPLPKEPDLRLAEDLVRELKSQRRLGGGSYPLTLGRLVELTRAGADAALVKKAVAHPTFAGEGVLALPRLKDLSSSPVALTQDREELADSPLTLVAALREGRSPTKHVTALGDLKKKLTPALQRPFEEAVARRIEERSLPASVGCLLQGKGKRLLFLMEDVISGRPSRPEAGRATAAPDRPASPDFAAAFDEAFRRLERQARMPNFVSLADLRPALPFDREAFDAGLRELRRAGRYTLSAAEGRHGISAEEQDAGIPEDGALLLFVSRKLT